MLFSIIIPVYNAEKYIVECMDSILAQTYTDYEIILVDDGSTDSSSRICDIYAGKSNNVKVVHQINSGASAARNKGVDNSTGNYLLFIDSDDYLAENNSLEKLADLLEESIGVDVVLLNSEKDRGDGPSKPENLFDETKLRQKSKDDVLEYFMSLTKTVVAPWIKAYRRELLIQEGIRFHEGITAEDIDFTLSVYKAANSFDYCKDYLYVYRKHEGSQSSLNSVRHIESILWTFERWLKHSPEIKFEEYTNSALANEYIILLYLLNNINVERKVYQEIKSYKWVLSYSTSNRARITRIVIQIFGIRLTSFALGIYKKYALKA